MTTLRWLAVALVTLRSAWMTFDGLRALVAGDYVTPRSGPYAGQLGPWRHVAQGVGLDPRGLPMKLAFVALGLAGLVAAAGFALRAPWAWAAMVGTAAATLWY